MHAKTVLYILILATAMGIVMSTAAGSIANPVFILLSAAPAALIVVSLDYVLDLMQSRFLLDNLFDSLYNASYLNASKMPLPRALQVSGEESRDQNVKRILSFTSKSVSMGRPLNESLSRYKSLLGKRMHEHLSSGSQRIEPILHEYGESQLQRRSEFSGVSQRYSTINMFLSTILPSFAVFMFIGSLITSSDVQSDVYLAATLLILIPVLYVLANVSMSRRLFG